MPAPAVGRPGPQPAGPGAQAASPIRYRIPEVRWGLVTALASVLGFAAFAVLGDMVLDATGLPQPVRDLIIWVLGYGLMTLVLVIISRRLGTGTLAGDFGLRFRWFDILIGIGSGVGAVIVGAMIARPVIELMGGGNRGNDAAAGESGVFLVLNGFVAVVIVAPFVEELLFRGLLLRSIRNAVLRPAADPSRRRRVVAAVVAVVGSSLLFAGVHLYEGWGSPVTMVALGIQTFVLGTVNAVYAATTFRLWPGIVTHMTFNLINAAVATVNAH